MKKLFTTISSMLSSSVAFVGSSVAAALPTPADVPGLETTGGSSDNIQSIIVKVITYVLDLVLIIGVVYVIIAGLRLIVSGGDEGEKDKAKQTIIYVIVGIIVVIFARVIVNFADNFFRA